MNNNEEFFKEAFNEAMQRFVTTWNSSPTGSKLTLDQISEFLLAASIFCFCEKYNFKHKDFEHAATLLNQAAAMLGFEEKF